MIRRLQIENTAWHALQFQLVLEEEYMTKFVSVIVVIAAQLTCQTVQAQSRSGVGKSEFGKALDNLQKQELQKELPIQIKPTDLRGDPRGYQTYDGKKTSQVDTEADVQVAEAKDAKETTREKAFPTRFKFKPYVPSYLEDSESNPAKTTPEKKSKLEQAPNVNTAEVQGSEAAS